MNKGFERTPRALLEIGVIAGGLLIPLLCAYAPRFRQSRMALFLPAAALVPAALFAVFFKGAGTLAMAARPSEAAEFYLYFFMVAYLIVFERRIREIERESPASRDNRSSRHPRQRTVMIGKVSNSRLELAKLLRQNIATVTEAFGCQRRSCRGQGAWA